MERIETPGNITRPYEHKFFMNIKLEELLLTRVTKYMFFPIKVV
jgi:hypothetical protein